MMNRLCLSHLTIRAAMVGAILIGTASAAVAQGVTPAADKAIGKTTLTLAREDPQWMLQGVQLNALERKAVNAIERKFARQFNALEWEFKAAIKAGKKDAPVFAKVETLRGQQRSEIRAMLSEEQQVAFDHNVAAR